MIMCWLLLMFQRSLLPPSTLNNCQWWLGCPFEMSLSLQHRNQLSWYTTNRHFLPHCEELRLMSSCNSMQHTEHQFVKFSIQLYVSMLPQAVTAWDPKSIWSFKHHVQFFIIRCHSTQASTYTISTTVSVSFYSTDVKHHTDNTLQNVAAERVAPLLHTWKVPA